MKLAIAAFATALIAATAGAQTVTDGDTIKLNGTTYRLWGIDAPESKQWCEDYPAGIMATGTLQMLIKGKTVVCEPKTTDRYGRTVAICRADGEDAILGRHDHSCTRRVMGEKTVGLSRIGLNFPNGQMPTSLVGRTSFR
jgi:Staphylococcal nuclease homologue